MDRVYMYNVATDALLLAAGVGRGGPDGVAGGGVLLAICALAFILRRSRRGQGKPDGAKAQHKMDTSSGASDNEHNPEKPILDSARSVRLLMTAAPDGTGLVPGELHGGSVPIELQGVDAR
ncbi:hypothetical protein MCOR15_010674 [Pyricularia oryzae]|nr:hypothetical protein MCOR15_010674 [Pyricularia oryzae]